MTDLRIETLDNGLTVATEHVQGARSVATGVWVGVGSRDEAERVAGVSHFLEHLLFKGTDRRSAQDIARSIDRVGGDFNAFTAREYTAYYCRLPARDLHLGVEVLADVLIRPALREADVESERQVILEELAMDDDAPDDVVHRLFAAQVFGHHPLGRDPAGRRDTVNSITPEDVRGFFSATYGADRMVVSVAGPLDHDEVLADIAEHFAELPSASTTPQRTSPGTPDDGVELVDDCEQVHVIVGGRSIAREHDLREALDVVNHVLGGGLSSRLFEEIRERRGLAYAVYSGVSSYADAGAYQLYAATQLEHAPTVTGLLRDALAQLLVSGITDDELAIAIGYLTGSFELGLEDTGARMARNAGSLTTVGQIRPVDEQLARWRAVDHDDVGAVIDEVFTAAPIVVTVGPA